MNSDGTPESIHEALYHQDVARRLLALREDLGRHDENLKAYRMLQCAPYFVAEYAEVRQALKDAYQSVKHVLPREELRAEDRDRDPYEAYYASNENERPFEVQYGIPVEECHQIPRVQMLLDWLGRQAIESDRYGPDLERAGIAPDELASFGCPDPSPLRVLDLSANDGFMAARLSLAGYRCDCLDLHPGNVKLARERKAAFPLIGRVEQGALERAAGIFSAPRGMQRIAGEAWVGGGDRYDAVVGFETIEHVKDPREMLAAMVACCAPGGRLYVSTPAGSVEQGNVPAWATVEPKGHVRVFTEATFRALLEEFGTVEELREGEDRVLVARVRPR